MIYTLPFIHSFIHSLYTLAIHAIHVTYYTGSNGRAVTLVTDSRRKVVKDMLKSDAALIHTGHNSDTSTPEKGRILSRSINNTIITEYINKISKLEIKITQLIKENKIEKQYIDTNNEINKATNMLLYDEEIHNRPVRTW